MINKSTLQLAILLAAMARAVTAANIFNSDSGSLQVKSDDGFESTHGLPWLDADANVSVEAGRKTRNIIARLDRGRGSNAAKRRRAGRDALHAAAAAGGKGVYFDRFYDDDDEDRGLLKGIMAAEVPAGRVNGLIASGFFELIEDDHPVGVLGWQDESDDNERSDSLRGGHRRLVEEVPWGIPFTESDQVPGNPNNRIKVCVADTGFVNGHEDLPYCPRSDQTCKDTTNGTDAYGENWDYDGHGHGTHCSGTIGAIGNNEKGVVGVFDSSSHWSLQVGKALSKSGSGSSVGVMAAVENCVLAGAKVVSMSLGCDECYQQSGDDFYTDIYLNKDVLIIAAAGNSGPTNNVKSYPASYKAVVSVAALDSNNDLAGFSQVNDQVEIAAPGVGVKSTIPGGQNNEGSYATWSGTSMATPHVSGVAAKVWSHFPQCSNYHIRNALGKSAVYPGQDETYCDWHRGHGNVRAKSMFDLLNSAGCGAGGISRGGNNTALGNMIGGCHQVYETLSPTISPAPSQSSQPSGIPSASPTPAPTVSWAPSDVPSLSSAPSTAHPTDVPSTSLVPSSTPSDSPTYAPTDVPREFATSPPTNSIQIQHGAMFDVKAKANITIYNMDISLYTTAPADVTLWTKKGSFWPARTYEAEWVKIGTAFGLRGTGKFAGKVTLPRHTFAPINVEAGATQAFYLSIPTYDVTNRISTCNLGTNLHGVWFENKYMSVHEGVYKSNWGHVVPDSFDATQSYRFIGSFYVVPEGTALPTASPTVTASPSLSVVPSSAPITDSPTTSSAPTGLVNSLITPAEGSSSESAYGYMFDIVGKGDYPIRILSFDLRLNVNQCAFQLYTKEGKNYFGYDDPSKWDLINEGTLTSANTKLSVGRQLMVNPGDTLAFYIAFLDCSGSWPLSVDRGENYTLGAWVEDDHIALMEGIKKAAPLSWSNPFGIGQNYYCCCSPGFGCSHSMRGSSINYEAIGRPLPTAYPTLPPAPPPTTSPTISMAPTMDTLELTTPTPSTGASAYGYYFDVVGKSSYPLRILNFKLRFKNDRCGLQIYTKMGQSYASVNQPSDWERIYNGTITRAGTTTKLTFGSFPQQTVNPGETRAFYFAFIECSGTWPLAVTYGSNYTLGTFAEDDNLALMEGTRRSSPLFWDNPFGIGAYCSCCSPGCSSSVSMLGGSIIYNLLAPPSTSPPTRNPTQKPSPQPTSQPSKFPTRSPTSGPTSIPTSAPTANPTTAPTLPPTSAPINSTPKPTSTPISSPTLTPTKVPTTAKPTNESTPAVTSATIEKFICHKNPQDDQTICLSGAPSLDTQCESKQGSQCGNGGKVCWVANCPIASGPSPPATSPPTNSFTSPPAISSTHGPTSQCIANNLDCPPEGQSGCCSGFCTKGRNKVCAAP